MPERFTPESTIASIVSSPKEIHLELGDESFVFAEYHIGEAPQEGIISPGNMETGDLKEIEKLYKNSPAMVNAVLPCADIVPYEFLHQEGNSRYGDYTSLKGQDEFKDSDMALTREQFSPPPWAQELWDFAKAKRPKAFKTDNIMACVRGLNIKNGRPVFTIGAGLYSQSFYSNGLEGVRIGLDTTEREMLLRTMPEADIRDIEHMAEKLEGIYGKGRTIRDVIVSRYDGHVPEFGDHIYNNSIGVAGMVLTRNNEFVFVKRGSNVSINQGVNCTSSGAAEFNEEMLSQHGLQHFLGNEISRETNEELGIKAGALILGSMKKKIQLELGVNDDDYELVPVGFVRELPRGGKPECMFLIQYKGTTTDLVRCIAQNPHSDKKEIDGSVYSLMADKMDKLLNTQGSTSFIQHKGVVNLMLCNEYLKKTA